MRLLAVLLCLLVLVPAAFAADTPARKTAWLRATVTIGADGRIETLDWRNKDEAAQPLLQRIDADVRAWEFEPATADGAPASAKTGLNVRVAVQYNPETRGVDLEVLEARIAPLSVFVVPPRYPIEGLRTNQEAFTEVVLRVGPDGATVVESVDVRASGIRHVFEEHIRAAAAAWRLEPEYVGGRLVESRVRVPISFCLQIKRSWCDRQRAAGNGPAANGEPVSLTPIVKLKTDVRAPRT